MIFLGNTASFHLSSWLRLYQKLGRASPIIATIHSIDPLDKRFSKQVRAAIGVKLLSYVLLGLKLRFSNGSWVQAHGASGYGLAALISGKPYIATVYGSEIFGAHGLLYRMMIRLILRRARIVTVTSETTKNAVIRNFAVKSENIRTFHTGIDMDFVSGFRLSRSSPADESKTVFSMRNTAAQYRTREIIESCIALNQKGRKLKLIVPLGNGDPDYFNSLRTKYDLPWITYLDSRLENQKMIETMADSDVCVSYPVSDQMSATILEALCLGRNVAIGALDAYSELIAAVGEASSLFVARNGDLNLALERALDAMPSGNASTIVSNRYGIDQAVSHVAELLSHFHG